LSAVSRMIEPLPPRFPEAEYVGEMALVFRRVLRAASRRMKAADGMLGGDIAIAQPLHSRRPER